MNYKILILFFLLVALNQCGMGADARKYPPEPSKRVQKNLEEGRGFRLMGGNKNNIGGNFEFASSNPLWKASLDTIDFMPLASANYSGGLSGRKDLITRQKREIRRFREEELTFGFAVLSRQYLDSSEHEMEEIVLNATQRITTTASELLERNPNETLMLQALLLALPALG